MKEVNSHIVSSFRWNTTFDRKDKAHELQERLSAWSRFTMPREMAAIFDKICPPDQTWRIKPFELDFGFMHYNDLEQELSEKLRRQLHEKLIDLVFYASRHGSGTIEIVDGETSRLTMLATFLVSGLMPWNYQSADGSVNQLMAYQLQHNRREAIAMIREVGAEHAVARKRMAWQFNEPVIIAIIEGLEPNYYTQVVEFSNDVAAIQQKETIVKASVADLKKNLWHWILNYLLKERGTLFNKLAFMKSSIRQMASHYNVAYHELLTLIERAVDIVIEKTTLRSEFVITLKALSQENRLANEATESTVVVADHWHDLETFFRKPGLCNTSEKKKEFNELVINLEQQDQAKFATLVNALGNTEKIWTPAVQQLNDPSLEVIFTALSPTRSRMLIETIYFLHSLTKAVNIKIDMKFFWNTGLDFLHSHKNSAFDNKAFTTHCIAAISKRKKITTGKLLAQLSTAKVHGAAKTLAVLDIYNHLNNSALTTNSNISTVFNAADFQKLLGRLGTQVNNGHMAVIQFKEWQGLFTSYVKSHPSQALAALINYPDKKILPGLLEFVMAKPMTQALISGSKHPNAQVLLWLQKAIGSIKESSPESESEQTHNKEKASIIANKAVKAGAAQRDQELLNKTTHKNSKVNSEQTLAKGQQGIPTQDLNHEAAIHNNIITTEGIPTEEEVTSSFTGTQNTSKKKENIQRLFNSLKEEEKEQVKEDIINQLTTLGVQLLLQNPSMGPLAFLRRLLKQLGTGFKDQQNNYLYQLLTQLPAGEALQAMGITQPVLTKLKETLPAFNDKFHIVQVQRFTRLFKTPKAATAQWLLANYKHTEFAATRTQNSSIATEIIHYFLPGGKALLEALLKEYSILPALHLKPGTEATVIQTLKDIFWQLLLDYPVHNGNAVTVKRLFKAAVAIQFNIKEAGVTSFLTASTGNAQAGWVQLKNGSRLSQAQFYLLAEQCLASTNGTVKYRGTEISIADLVQIALRTEAAPLLKIFSQRQLTTGAANKITAAVPFNEFVLWLMQDSAGELRQTLKALYELPALLSCILQGTNNRQLTEILWQHTWQLIKNGSVTPGFLENLVSLLFKKIATKKINSPAQVSEQLGNKGIVLSAELTAIVNNYLPGVINNKALPPAKAPSEWLNGLEKQGLLEDLALYILTNKKVPVWLHGLPAAAKELPPAELLNGIIVHHPALFLKIYSHRVLPQAQLEWLGQVVNFNDLTVAIAAMHGNKQSLLAILAQFHTALGHLVIRGIGGKELQNMLFKKVMKAWAGNNWRLVATETIWNELTWDVSTKYGVLKEIFMQAVTKQLTMFPPALQTAFNYLAGLNKAITVPLTKAAALKPKQKNMTVPIRSTQNQGSIPVKNAGIVLLQNYVPLLFERLKLANDKKFNSEADQADAVHYLQYVVTGLTETEEGLLPLNKVLCGLPFTTPLKPGIDMTGEQKTLVDGLINAAMGYWPAIGSNSINGFRGNWLVRDGLLVEQEERWELTVDKRAYDLLIHKSPFSFSIIKYPWMDKPLHVNWPY